ncbi:Ribosomal protein S21 family protein [Forsythia ovata]|uniref:Ribosomal protein S21 family protein n=1 Tax=Forsythia ovata TaxID=205694 RepID=A0ABD1WWN9_9LAMI
MAPTTLALEALVEDVNISQDVAKGAWLRVCFLIAPVKSLFHTKVIADENEPEEKLIGRFRREVMRAGVIQECKRCRFFENKQDKKKRKSREAAKCNRRRTDALKQETSLRMDKRLLRTRRKRRKITGIFLKATFPIDLRFELSLFLSVEYCCVVFPSI